MLCVKWLTRVTSLHASHVYLYIFLSLFGLSTFFVASLVLRLRRALHVVLQGEILSRVEALRLKLSRSKLFFYLYVTKAERCRD